MIPEEFRYLAPRTLADASATLASERDAKLLAGGMSLIPALKHRLAQPETLIDLGRIEALRQVSAQRGRVEIAAMVTHADLERGAGPDELALLRETASEIGDPQVRNRGTLCGSLVHADPAGDWAAVFLALGGEAIVLGPRGERRIASDAFFVGMLTSALSEDEILVRVALPYARRRAGTAYCKVRQRASGFALVGVAVQVVCDRRGRIEDASIAVTGVNPTPFRARALESRVRGLAPGGGALAELPIEIDEAQPMDDLHASGEYRLARLRVECRRALGRAWERARA
ncbi:MAG: FAD binding domain-containing protein [Myxococcota bacterium]